MDRCRCRLFWCSMGFRHISILMILLSLENGVSQNMDRETAASRLCRIENGLIHCAYVPLKTQNVTVLGNVHACTEPVYVQFVIGLTNSRQKSKYTFINSDETKTVKGLTDHVRLHVLLQHIDGYIFLKATFLQEDQEGFQEIFLETHLDMPDEAQCVNSDTSADRILPIAIVAVASVLIAMAAVLLLYCWHRKRRRAKLAATELLADMESSPSAVPYQEEAISGTLSVSGPKPGTTTVIQNSLYRDSVVLDDSLDTIAEEGDDGGTSGGNSRNHKQRQRRPRRRPANNAVPSRNGQLGDAVDLVDVGGHGSESSLGNGQTGDLLTETGEGGVRSPVSDGPVIARIAPPPQINVSPPSTSSCTRDPTGHSH